MNRDLPEFGHWGLARTLVLVGFYGTWIAHNDNAKRWAARRIPQRTERDCWGSYLTTCCGRPECVCDSLVDR